VQAGGGRGDAKLLADINVLREQVDAWDTDADRRQAVCRADMSTTLAGWYAAVAARCGAEVNACLSIARAPVLEDYRAGLVGGLALGFVEGLAH